MKKIIKLMLLVCIMNIGFSYAETVFSPTLNVDTSISGKIIVTVSADEDNDIILANRKPSLSIPCEFTKAHVEYDGKTITSTLKDGEITFVVEKSGQYVIVKETTVVKPSSSGGGGSSSKSSTTTKNEDGSVTKTVTDKKTGTVTETTKNVDGSTSVVEKTKDGTITTTVTDTGGNKTEVIESTSEETSVSISVSTVESTKQVELPISPVSNNEKLDIKITKPVTITMPVENMTNNVVAVIVFEDGTEKVIRKSVVDGENMIVPMTESATIKFIDNSKEFTDTAKHWGESAIDFVTSHELFNGTSKDTFDPNMSMNRAMVAQVLHNLETNPKTDYTSSFNDVGSDVWYQEAVNWVANKGIVSGYDNGMFGAKDNVTREQLVTILYNYAKSNAYDISVGENTNILTFKDFEKTSEYAISALKWAVEKGIMSGSYGYLNPKGYATRAEVASMMQKFCLNIR